MTEKNVWVLIIEDDITTRRIIAGLLHKKGFEIICADNGKQAEEVLKFCSPDCILLDLIMPKMHGHAFLTNLRENRVDIPVIIMSAIEKQPDLVATIQNIGIQGWIAKPVDAEEAAQKIKEAVEARKE